jgi:uncharacterized protein (DUF1499 family)
MINAHNILHGKAEGKISFGHLGVDRRRMSKLFLKEHGVNLWTD